METHVMAMVVLAGVLHAAWNAFLKSSGDKLATLALIEGSAGIIALGALPFVPFPAAAVWPYLAASFLIHIGYHLLLVGSYHIGDLSHVYPIARGSGPLLVALVSVAVLGESMTRTGLLAVIIIGLGVMSLAFTKGAEGFRDPRPVIFALGTGCLIAAYTIVDGLGARQAGSPHGYTLWLFALNGPALVLILLLRRRGGTLRLLRQNWRLRLVAGVMSLVSYWLVVWALTLAPLALVAALRETSIVFAVLFGVVFLKERLSLVQLTVIATSLIGVVMLKLNR